MAHELALMTLNALKAQMAQMARAVVTALDDNKLSFGEGLTLGQQGVMLGITFASTFRGLSQEQARSLCYVVEHGMFTLPDAGPPVLGAPEPR